MKLTTKQLAETVVDLLSEAPEKSIDETAQTFIEWLAGQGELGRVRNIMTVIDEVWKERFGAAKIHVTTAHPLTREARKSLETVAQGATLTDAIDPELIGGARLQIDDRLMDGSIRGALTRLQETLSQS